MDFDIDYFKKNINIIAGDFKLIISSSNLDILIYLIGERFELSLEVYKKKIIIKNIEVEKKREGLGTEIVNFLIQYSKSLKKDIMAFGVRSSKISWWEELGFFPDKDKIYYIFKY